MYKFRTQKLNVPGVGLVGRLYPEPMVGKDSHCNMLVVSDMVHTGIRIESEANTKLEKKLKSMGYAVFGADPDGFYALKRLGSPQEGVGVCMDDAINLANAGFPVYMATGLLDMIVTVCRKMRHV